MKKDLRHHIKNSILTFSILGITFAFSLVLQNFLSAHEHVTTVFVFAVFLVSVLTDGYLYGIITAFLGVIAVNFAFTFPFFALNFSIPENAISALVMIVISLTTSTLTTKLKHWQEIKSEGERERMRANLLRAISHDLRTPLTTIYGSSSAILDNYGNLSDESKMRLLTGIKDDSQWLISMVENLLSVTRFDSGAVKLIKSPTVLEELIDATVLKFRKRYPDRMVEIDIPDEMLIIPMDALLIEQVLINIFENAIHHAVGMTRLSLRVYTEDDVAVFEISDNGCGVDKDRLNGIFSGARNVADQPMDTKRRNAGIGLSVCASIIKAHGGSISAANSEQGGAVFSFRLNISDKGEVYEQQ